MARSRHKQARVSGVRAVWLAGTVFALCALAGCKGNYTRSGTSQGRPVIGPFRAKDENPFLQQHEQRTGQQEIVQVAIWRVTISNQEQKQAEEFWKLFRPTRLPANNAGLLRRNGLTIRSGDQQSWTEALSKLEIGPGKQRLGTNKVQQWGTRLTEGRAAELPVSESVDGVTLFWHESDGRLVGKTYETCQKLLVITAVARPTGQVQIKLVPALKAEGARARSLRKLKLLSGIEPEKYVAKFERLALEAIVSSDEFLIIGSAAQADEGAFGRAFFDDTDQLQPSRTVLLIIPRVISSEQVK
ncbi:MAG: hypothetical protein KAT11_03095 [Phycisphaerae bacterium]|nr:hypothetical protein [Phycisphaerae bacterium]